MTSFLDSIRSLFRTGSPDAPAAPATTREPAPPIDPVHLAACALLLEVAWADGEFSEAERRHLEGVLERHFALPPQSGRQLIAIADEERRRSIDHFGFASVLRSRYDLGQKMVLAEVMWGLVLADGTIAEHEHYLTRKIANLLDLEPGYLSHAKLAAAQRATGSTPPDES
ncbi:MAG TPA: TerB family tellurite resistance protein [Gemmatimonadaceae bacterium]|nr:TerB family tellurite resistance protein [Gemmatimonadaceae bacterium]